eukprot:766795-Hanusia_phi.AAC.4
MLLFPTKDPFPVKSAKMLDTTRVNSQLRRIETENLTKPLLMAACEVSCDTSTCTVEAEAKLQVVSARKKNRRASAVLLFVFICHRTTGESKRHGSSSGKHQGGRRERQGRPDREKERGVPEKIILQGAYLSPLLQVDLSRIIVPDVIVIFAMLVCSHLPDNLHRCPTDQLETIHIVFAALSIGNSLAWGEPVCSLLLNSASGGTLIMISLQFHDILEN